MLREQVYEIKLVLMLAPRIPTEFKTTYIADLRAKLNPMAQLPSFEEVPAPRKPDAEGLLKLTTLDMSLLDCKFRLKLLGLDNVFKLPALLRGHQFTSLTVEATLFAGFTKIHDYFKEDNLQWNEVSLCNDPRWSSWQSSQGMYSQLPRGTRIGFEVFGHDMSDHPKHLLAYVVQPLVDEFGRMLTGQRSLRLWPHAPKEDKHKKPKPDPTFLFKQTTRENLMKSSTGTSVLTVQFESFVLPVTAPYIYGGADTEPDRETQQDLQIHDLHLLKKEQHERYDFIKTHADPLHEIKKSDRVLIWQYRHHLVSSPGMLAKLFQSVNFTKPSHVLEAHRLLEEWTFPDADRAMELLDCK
jgi:hypothetical protein